MSGICSMTARKRALLALGVSVSALAVSQTAHAQAQPCPNGQPGPVCVIPITADSGAIVGNNGNILTVNNSGTITGDTAITQGGAIGLAVNNSADGTITGTGGIAITGTPRFTFKVRNSGTINGNVVYNDPPAPNAFVGPQAYFISDGGTLNGDLLLGTTGFSTAAFYYRGSDDGVTGTISAGAGLDIYGKIYESSQTLTLGQYSLPASFEIEGYWADGAGTVLTLTGTSTTINLGGNGQVVNNGVINAVDPTSSYPAGATVLPAAISYFQPSVAAYARPSLASGQPNSLLVVPFGSALSSFTNNGTINAEINLATAKFVNTGDINLATVSNGSLIYGAANTAFVFDNQGSIEMAVTGFRLPQPMGEFDDGIGAAIRLRSAINTNAPADVSISNSGEIIGGLNGRFAASNFNFENTGLIEGINASNYYVTGLVLNVGEMALVLGSEERYDADTATFINGATGTISNSMEAYFSAFDLTFENHGLIEASSVVPDALFIEQGLDEDGSDATSLEFVNTGEIDGNVGIEAGVTSLTIDNSGTITGRDLPVNSNTYPELMFGGETAFEIDNETTGNGTLTFNNTGTISTVSHAGSGVVIEVEAGDSEPENGGPPIIANANVVVTNSGTISATGGATLVPQQFATFLEPGQNLVNPMAALAVDATDVTGDSTISITNATGGLIEAGGTWSVAAPNGYTALTLANPGVFTVAVYATGKTINITNAGTIKGAAGNALDPAAIIVNSVDLYDNYLAGAIHTAGDEYGPNDEYVGSVDHLTNTATGVVIGSIDLGANDDRIDNAGSITGAIFLRDGDDSLYNYGSITGDIAFGAGDDLFVQGIQAVYSGTADGGDGNDSFLLDITAGGTINDAIYSQLINFETLALTGTGAVDVDLGDSDDEVANDGTINGDVGLGSGSNSFVNSGTVTGNVTSGEGDDSIGNDGTIEGNVNLGDGANQFANTGNVTGNVTGGSAGDVITNGGEITGDVDLGAGANQFANTGTLTGSLLGGDDGDDVNNEGQINGSVDLGGGSNVFANMGQVTGDITGGNDNDNVENGGTITGDIFLDAAAPPPQTFARMAVLAAPALGGGDDTFSNDGTLTGNLYAGGGTDVITNLGIITGDIDLGDGDDELVLRGDWEIGGTAFGGDGEDVIDLAIATNTPNIPVLDLSGFESFEVLDLSGGTGMVAGSLTIDQINILSGRLIGDHDSLITGNVNVSAGGTFGSAGVVNGNIGVASGGTLSPGASPAVMTVNGDISLASGSATVFEFVPAPGQSDQLIVNGDLAIASGAILNITGTRPLTPGTAYDLIIANSISGEFTIGTWDHSAVQGFLRYLDGSANDRLQLLGTFVLPDTASPQANLAVSYVNDLLISGLAPTPLLDSITELLDGDGFASADAFTLLTPEPYASATQMAVERGLSLAKVSRDGIVETNREEAGLFGFGSAYGNWRSLDADSTLGTSKARNRDYGIVGGIGYGKEEASIGAFVGYVDGRQTIEALGAQTNSDGIVAGIAGHFGTGGFSFDALVGYDWSEAETSRVVPGSDAVSSEYDLESFVVDAHASYDLPIGGMILTPAVGITHVSVNRGSAIERGSDAFALDVAEDDHSATFIDGTIALSGGDSVRPWARAGVRQQVEGELAFASGALVGSTTRFTVPGAPREDTVVLAGAGVEADVGANATLSVSYNGEFGSGTGSTAAIGLKVGF